MEKAEGAAGPLVKMKGFTAGGNSTIVYFSSEDCSIEEARVVEAVEKFINQSYLSANMDI